ncbi:MAG: M23 family metallopeptidase [Chthoniobacteraceae bacterium]
MQTARLFSLFIVLVGVVSPFCAYGGDAPVTGDVVVSQQRNGDVIQIYAENVSGKPLAITLQLSNILHAKSEGWPVKVTKRCLAGDRMMMTALIQNQGERAATFTCTITTAANPASSPVPQLAPQPALLRPGAYNITLPTAPARPPVEPAKAPEEEEEHHALPPVDPDFCYRLPYQNGTSHLLSQGYGGVVSHHGAFALDFDMPEGTPVCAARDGVVIEIQKSREYSDNDSIIGNFIAIKHVDGTVALYAQLAKDGVTVTVGQKVRAGDVIGSSGSTGHTNGPHLHFEVDSLKDCVGVTLKGERGSIPVVFDARESTRQPLHVGNTYTAE